jgi:hypothetical protein
VNFSSRAVDQVFAEYEQRNTDERAKAASLGSKMFARRDEFLLPVGREVKRKTVTSPEMLGCFIPDEGHRTRSSRLKISSAVW